jgi:hypothetical protein
MADSSQAIQDWYTRQLHKYFSRRYRAYLRDDSREQKYNELGRSATYVERADHGQLPEEVRGAHAYYWKHFEETDLGSARVYRALANRKPIYAIRVTTDGDDGFVEVYDKKGTFLAATRRYIEVVAWGSRDWLRAQATHPWDLPPELQDAPSRTLWGQPVEGFHCMKTCKHPCTFSPRGRCIEKAGHLQANGSPHRCSRCGFTWGGKPQPPAPPAPVEPKIEPWMAKIYFTEGGGSYDYNLRPTPLTIVTKDGSVTVPLEEVQQIDFASREGGAGGSKKPRKSDVIRTADARWVGTLEGDALETYYPGGVTQRFTFAEMKKLRALTREEVEEANTFYPPGTLITSGGCFGAKTRYRITGHDDGRVYGTDVYSLDSYVETAAVHAGLVQPGEEKVLLVEIIPSPPRFKGSTRNGITSAARDAFPSGAFRFVEET